MNSSAAVAALGSRLSSAMQAVQPLAALATPQLSGLRRAAPHELDRILTRLLTVVNSRFNLAVNKKMDPTQIGLCVSSLLTSFWHLKFDELVYVLREGITGKFHTFDHLDEGVIMGWFREYEAGEREAHLAVHCHHERSTPEKTALQKAQMGPVYVLKACHDNRLTAEDLPAYKAQLEGKWPDQPELLNAVDAYAAHLVAVAAAAQVRENDQRARVKAMLARTVEVVRRVPGELEFASDPTLVVVALPNAGNWVPGEREFAADPTLTRLKKPVNPITEQYFES